MKPTTDISQFSHELKEEDVIIGDNEYSKIDAEATVDWELRIKDSAAGAVILPVIREIRMSCKLLEYDTVKEESRQEIINEENGWKITTGYTLNTPIRPRYIIIQLKAKRVKVFFKPLGIN